MSLSAVLLAGGKSRRMGQDKATMTFRGRPLWQHQLDVLRRLKPDKILVSAQVEPAWRPADVNFVVDVQPARAPLSGISAALSRTASDHLLVLAIDMPFMTHDWLGKLCERIAPDLGIVPMIEDRAEPLAAIYPRTTANNFAGALAGTDFSLQSLLRDLIRAGKILPIPVSNGERAFFRNFNAPGDFSIANCS